MSWSNISAPVEKELLVGFFDLTGYTRICQKMPEMEVLQLMAGYFDLTGRILAENGGLLVKAIGDAGLAAFPAEQADKGVRAFLDLKDEGESWLKAVKIDSRAVVKLHVGPVACGHVGAPTEKRFDIYGKTVNTAALVPSKGFAMTPQVFRLLSKETRALFKKHTPPVTYIAQEDRH